MAEFTGETPSEVNRRAHDRAGQNLIPANRSQVIEIACHLSNLTTRKTGKDNQLYSRETALALLNITTNFTPDWTRETAIAAVTETQRKKRSDAVNRNIR